MKKNLELKHNSKEVKLSKKNYIIIIIPIVIVLIFLIVLALFIYKENTPSNKLKNHLEEIGYSCNKKTCSKQVGTNNYTINYSDISIYIDTEEYHLTLSKEILALELKNEEYICSYIKDDYTLFTTIDSTFIYDKKCAFYIPEINEFIKEYKSIVNSSGIDVNNLEE